MKERKNGGKLKKNKEKFKKQNSERNREKIKATEKNKSNREKIKATEKK